MNISTDWLMVIITAIYVIATIFICRFNWVSAKSARIQTEEMQRQYKEMQRPIVSVSMEAIRSGLCCFVIENVGQSPAHNVNININEEFLANIPNKDGDSALRKLSNAHMFMASKQKFTVLICGQKDFSNVMKVVAKLHITYDGYNEDHEIGLSQYSYMLVYNSPLEDVSQHLMKIEEQDKAFHRDIVKKIPSKTAVSHVVVHNETEEDAIKYKIFKYISMNNGQNANQIAEDLQLDKENCMRLLIELQQVDHFITCVPSEDANDDYSYAWYRN